MASGGSRAAPITCAAGRALPALSRVQVPALAPLAVALISVVVRLVAVLPGRNSSTRPETLTASPANGLLALPRKT